MCEAYLRKYGCILHPNNVLMVRIKSKLSGLYGRCPGYDMMEMTYNRAILNRKLQICQETLVVLNKLQPGLSRSRGILLYELHLPMFMGAKLDIDNKMISGSEAKIRFEEALKYLHEAIGRISH